MKKVETTLINRNVEVELPLLPNFIRSGKEAHPIKSFSKKELQEIGKKWTYALLEKAGYERNI